MPTTITVDTLVRRATGGPVMLVLTVAEPIGDVASLAICAWPHTQRIVHAAISVDLLVTVR
jgi:hypothetical protein